MGDRAFGLVDRPCAEWTEIPVPAIVSQDTFDRVARQLADNKRFASRNSKIPSLLQGLAACAACGYGYYRTTTRTTNKKIHYYRCLGSDNYHYEAGRVCVNQPVRADYLDTVVWDHLTGLLGNPQLIRAEIARTFAARYPDDVVGMVLVDSTAPGATHEALIADEKDSAATTQAILDVVSSIRSAGQLAR